MEIADKCACLQRQKNTNSQPGTLDPNTWNCKVVWNKAKQLLLSGLGTSQWNGG